MTDNQKQYVVNTLCKMTESDGEIADAISIRAKEAISALGYEDGYSIRVNAFNIGNTVHINITLFPSPCPLRPRPQVYPRYPSCSSLVKIK